MNTHCHIILKEVENMWNYSYLYEMLWNVTKFSTQLMYT